MTQDPRFLPHVTPTQIAEARYEAARAKMRRKPGPGGMPKPEHVYEQRNEHALLLAITQQAWRAYLAEVTPADWRDRVQAMLAAEIDRLYPAADMAVLERYEAHQLGRSIVITIAGHMHELALTPARPLPRKAVLAGGQVQFFVGEAQPRAIPQAAEPYFEALRQAYASKYQEFDRATAWAGAEASRKRPPTWAQIEETFPRIGAWIAEKRGIA